MTSLTALLLLSLLWAFELVRADLLPGLVPDSLPHMERQAVPLILLAVAAALIAILRHERWPRSQLLWSSVLVGLGMFAAPAALLSLAGGWVPGLARAALFTLTPVFSLVFEPHIGGSYQPSRGALPASLASVLGALCVFPAALPESVEAGLALCTVILAAVCVAAANCKAVALATKPAGELASQTMTVAAIAAAAPAAVFLAASAIMERPVLKWNALAPELLWSAAVEVPALLLLFWLMRRMSATRMVTRYVIAPLLAVLIGVVLMRPSLPPRTWLGLLLMAGGAAYILLAPEAETESTGLSLH